MKTTDLFWVEDDSGKFTLMGPDYFGYFSECRNLPIFFNRRLEFNKLGFTSFQPIPGMENDQGSYVYDPKCYEFEEITAPVKYSLGFMLGYSEYYPPKSHTGKVPTAETVKAAQKVADTLYKQFQQLEQQQRYAEFDELFNITCKNDVCIFREGLKEQIQSEVNPDKYTTFNLYDPDYPWFMGIIIKKDALPIYQWRVQIPVWHLSVGKAIGSKGKNAKKLANALGVKYVDIVPEH